uniref:Ubiquitin-like protease family profile domain-containing protein n=1 Tax=Triticum urartu TaxID=4572 RepID=A0A8R7PXK1_TRIUA
MPNGRLSRNVVVAGIDFIKEKVDIHCDNIIMSPTITRRIWEGDFSHREVRKAFAQHGDSKLTLKKFVMFTMYQELTPDDPVDKCGHYYTVCINLRIQRFDVLDYLHWGDDETLRSHAELFIENLKQTWLRHYEGSKVQINDFPIEYVKTAKKGTTRDCGIYLLEYLAKWEGRKLPT